MQFSSPRSLPIIQPIRSNIESSQTGPNATTFGPADGLKCPDVESYESSAPQNSIDRPGGVPT